MTSKSIPYFSRTLLPVFLLTSTLFAQSTGRVTGTIVDAAGGAVPNARVELRIVDAAEAAIRATTTREGLFAIPSIPAGYYDLVVRADGFQNLYMRRIKVEPGRELGVGTLKLELGAVTESIEVTADAPGVQTTNAEVSITVTNSQLTNLPLLDRDPLDIIRTQAGVTTGLGPTVINGLRTSYANVTIDGINVQDNAVRSNSLNFLPNLPFTDQMSELTLVTSTPDATWSGGAAQVSISTPSGTNLYHGGLLWYNRNSTFAANSWFNNSDGVDKPQLNLNQFGGNLGGPILRNKLFFYSNYEVYRYHQQTLANRALLTADARQGIFGYLDSGGAVRKVNVVTLMRSSLDLTIQQLLGRTPGPERINNTRVSDPAGNFGGYSFNLRNNRIRDNVTGKLDYYYSTRHNFAASYLFNRDLLDRPDDTNNFSPIPPIRNDNTTHLLSLSWRWTPTARLTNEVRWGFNRAPGDFVNLEPHPEFLIGGLVFSNPVNTAYPEYRLTNTYNMASNASYVFGRHHLRFGYQQQTVRLNIRIPLGTTPAYNLGIGLGNQSLDPSMLPGIGADDFDLANAFMANMTGLVSSYAQTFNVTSRNSGFVPGAPDTKNLRSDTYALYVQDTWKLRPSLTLSAGVRWDYHTPVDERDGLALMPVVFSNDVIATLRSNAILDFAGRAVNRPWYQRDLNNFAPNLALAWSPFRRSRTSFRAGYSVSLVNDEDLVAMYNNLINTNAGLVSSVVDTDLTASLRSPPRIPLPDFNVPRTAAQNQFNDPGSAIGLPDPKLQTPYVQHWNVGIQHEWRNFLFEARYVGNHATKMWRAIDYNQIDIRHLGYLDDFIRARRNGQLSEAARGIFDPRYNPNVAGSQPLTVFPRMPNGGFLTNSIVQSYIRTGEPAELGLVYVVNGINGPIEFLRNPSTLGANLMSNYSHSTYNSLQLDARHRLAHGLMFQANYSFSKVLSDSGGTTQFRFEPFLDFNNPGIERSRPSFDVTHVINANWIWELPMGSGRKLNYPKLKKLFDGWALSGITSVYSGLPFSILSGRATLNRSSRSGNNTATTLLTMDQLDGSMGVRVTGNGPYFVDASVIGPDGRAVAPDGRAPFSGQAFFHPGPGEIGTLQRRSFNGPWSYDFSFGLRKTTQITERYRLMFRANAFNALNQVNWFVTSMAIDSVNFGRIGIVSSPRQFQFGLHLEF